MDQHRDGVLGQIDHAGINDYIVHGVKKAVNPAQTGTKASALYRVKIGPGKSAAIRLRLGSFSPAR